MNLVVASAIGTRYRAQADHDTLVTHALTAEDCDASEDGTGRGTPLVVTPFDTTQITSGANRSNPQPGDPCHPLAAGAHPPAIAFRWNAAGSDRTTIHRAGAYAGALGATSHDAVVQGMAVRRLTPRECARLQGFPDDWLDDCGLADTPRYRLLGNAIAVPVGHWLFTRLVAAVEAPP